METINVIMLMGLPGSGKSTWAKEYIKNHPQYKYICKDEIRATFNTKYIYDDKFEKVIFYTIETMILSCIECGYDIIIDETNLFRRKRGILIDIIGSMQSSKNIKIHYKYFIENKNNLFNRMKDDKGVSQDVWETVIKNMQKDADPPNFETEVPMELRGSYEEISI